MTRVVYVEKIPSTDPRLGRHIRHDSESRRYAHDTSGLTVASVEHQRVLPILDQGQVGSCTANCALGLLGTAPYASDGVAAAVVRAFGSDDEAGALRFYSAEEVLDGDGPYPPQDNGSTGLTMAKVARAAGCISGWTQVFTLVDFLKALTQYPIGCGTYWYNSMFIPSSSGVVAVDPGSGIAGGHEYECVGYDASTDRLKFANSWGTGFGDNGYFYMSSGDFGRLLANQGDATIFTPASQPAPTPTPTPVPTPPADAFTTAAKVLDPWAALHHTSIAENRQAAAAWRTYAKAVRGQ